jgi:hypothetical protein
MNYIGDSDGGSRSGFSSGLMPGGWLYQNMLTISRFFEDFTLPAVDQKERRVFPDRARDGEQALTQMRTTPYSIFAKMLLPALQKAVIKSARMQTYTDAARAGCALERYRLANGNFPERLDELMPRYLEHIPNDVIDGNPCATGSTPMADIGSTPWAGTKKMTTVKLASSGKRRIRVWMPVRVIGFGKWVAIWP